MLLSRRTARTVRPVHAGATGLCQHYVLVNRQTGRIEIIGVWDSAEDVARIAPELEPARQRLWAQFGTNPPLEIFEVAESFAEHPMRLWVGAEWTPGRPPSTPAGAGRNPGCALGRAS